MVRSADHKASSYVVFSLPCYLLSCRIKYPLSCFRTPSFYIPPWM